MKTRISGLMAFVFALVFLNGCATMFRTNQASVVAASGASVPVRVLSNGVPVYEGNLPAAFPVRSGNTYTVIYTLENGESRTVVIGERFNGWFIGSILLGFLPAVVDLVTQSVLQVEKTTVLPIAYSPTIILTDYVAEDANLLTIGRFDYDEQALEQ